jgi:hypothetical protein
MYFEIVGAITDVETIAIGVPPNYPIQRRLIGNVGGGR